MLSPMLSPMAIYQQDLQREGFVADAAQAEAVALLQALYERLVAREDATHSGGWINQWRALWKPNHPPAPLAGLYLWGGVGRGKTYLMDVFYDSLPLQKKMRTHFHRFMRRVHAELTLLKGQKNPLDQIAAKLADEASIICFDEFFVTDITDAMLLGNLLRALFERGVVLVATSNIAPDGLYANGLQRERFLPAIALLNRHTQVVNVDGGVDYRLRVLQQASLYYSPLNSETARKMEMCFLRLMGQGHHCREQVDLLIEGRQIRAQKEWEDLVWFDFRAICDGPRSQHDYIVLAKEYHTVMVSGVPSLGAANDDQARRFIYLVDEFYDRGVKLIISAAQPIESLYVQGKLNFEFARTQSRLLEMQSEAYLQAPHKPG